MKPLTAIRAASERPDVPSGIRVFRMAMALKVILFPRAKSRMPLYSCFSGLNETKPPPLISVDSILSPIGPGA